MNGRKKHKNKNNRNNRSGRNGKPGPAGDDPGEEEAPDSADDPPAAAGPEHGEARKGEYRKGEYREGGSGRGGPTLGERVERAGQAPCRRDGFQPRERRPGGRQPELGLRLLTQPRVVGKSMGGRPEPVDLAYRCGPFGEITTRRALRQPTRIRGILVGVPGTLKGCPACGSREKPVLITPGLVENNLMENNLVDNNQEDQP